MRHVPAVVDYLQSRTRYLFVKSLGELEWDEFIFAAPHNERRFMDRAKSAVQDIFAAEYRVKNLINSVAVSSSHPLFECKIDILVEALVVKCERPQVANILAAGQTQRAQSARIHRFWHGRVTCCVTQDKPVDSL